MARELPEIDTDAQLQQVLWACYEYWTKEPSPPSERTICYKWVLRLYKKRFGGRFHQSKLSRLAKLGLLRPDQTARGGNRRYYELPNPGEVQRLLQKWGML